MGRRPTSRVNVGGSEKWEERVEDVDVVDVDVVVVVVVVVVEVSSEDDEDDAEGEELLLLLLLLLLSIGSLLIKGDAIGVPWRCSLIMSRERLMMDWKSGSTSSWGICS